MKTGGPITIAIDSLSIFEIGIHHVATLIGLDANEPRMPVLAFSWTRGAHVVFSLS